MQHKSRKSFYQLAHLCSQIVFQNQSLGDAKRGPFRWNDYKNRGGGVQAENKKKNRKKKNKHAQILSVDIWSKHMLASGPRMLRTIIGPDIDL